VAKRLIEFVGDSDFQLVETLAERVAEIVLTEFDVEWVRLRVNKKGAVRYAGDVGIIIERSSERSSERGVERGIERRSVGGEKG